MGAISPGTGKSYLQKISITFQYFVLSTTLHLKQTLESLGKIIRFVKQELDPTHCFATSGKLHIRALDLNSIKNIGKNVTAAYDKPVVFTQQFQTIKKKN